MPSPRKTFIERLIRWRLLFVVNFLVIVFLGLSLSREMIRSRAIDSQIDELQARQEELATRNINLSGLKTAMQTSTFIEREARLKLGMKKPGETVVVIVGQDMEPAVVSTDDVGAMAGKQGTGDANDPLGLILGNQDSTIEVANPTKWWYYFFDKPSFNTLSDYGK